MTLPSTGAISLEQMRVEFGLPRPVSMSQMRDKGGAPASGAISFATMRGRSNVSFTPSSNEVAVYGQTEALVMLSCSQEAVWTYTKVGGADPSINLASGGTGTFLTIRFNPSSVVSQATYNVTATVGGISMSWNVYLETTGTV